MRSRVIFAVLFILAGAGIAVLRATPYIVDAQSPNPIEARRTQLQAELLELEAQMREQQALVDGKRTERVSLERDIAILDAEIQKARLAIRARDIEIQQLTGTIYSKEEIIAELDAKLEREKEALAQFVRKTYEIDQVSMIEIILGNRNFTDFFEELDDYEAIKAALRDSFRMVEATKQETQAEKISLESKHQEELELRRLQEMEKDSVERQEREKQRILRETRGEESRYQQMLATTERTAAEIRAELFALRDTTAIPFGEAYQLALEASRATGVRPAFILAILKQETDLGSNVGTCNRPNDPPEKSWRHIMPGPNDGHRSSRDDQTVFLRIMQELGRSPDGTPLSCPWGNGWGGAMGPSQFIPTTWASYAPRVAAALGVPLADPWNPRHAFFATAIFMQDLGAAAGTHAAEREAALRYYAGGNWNRPQNAFYGDSVMQHAAGFQRNIDILNR